ncbi:MULTISPECIES: Hvo_1808 family surface protein [Halorussus]|uniref:Hvo_1808 family surface protein n=1 Tax=Halorussus TaxID=1070314 RepID=UPI000E219B49|nr:MULTISPECIES: Hvo_1808 family surface protein [Halorussus]NHN60936.1 right-handed parallel beta-helix repeat-containing protein [Halorussus sp. JP-T4]
MTNRQFAVVACLLMLCWSAAGAGAAGGAATGDAMPGTTGDAMAGTAGDRAANAAAQATEISSCRTIARPGRYVLTGDIENSSADTCIRIRASDVVLDGNGHAVDGVTTSDPDALTDRFFGGRVNPFGAGATVGVAATANRRLSNVTVTDLTVTDWRWGVVASGVRNGRLAGVRAENNGFGVTAIASPGATVTDGAVDGNAVLGVGAFRSDRVRVANVTAAGNGFAGVYLSGGTGGTVADVTARDNDLAGVLLESTTGASVTGGTASDNRVGVTLLFASGTDVRRTAVVGNGLAGVRAVNATGTTVFGVSATNNNLAGVLLENGTEASVVATDASRNQYGVYAFRAADAAVTDSTAENGSIGVFYRNVTGGAVTGNAVLNNRIGGVTLENSTGVRVASNRDGAVVFDSTGDETIGVEGGVRYDDAIAANQSDGLTDRELRAYVYRAIARAEHLRQLEYTGSVSLEVVSRDELERRSRGERNDSGLASAWDNQFWEALFVVGEDANATAEMNAESTRIGGFYHPLTDKLVVVSEEADPVAISSTTLVHEFVHALQDQHFDLTRRDLAPAREDAFNARNALVEGDARYADERFEALCGVAWNCLQVEAREPSGGNVSPTRNFAMRQLALAPYSDGPGYVEDLRERGGWDAVNDAYDDLPASTEQILHPERRNEPPVRLDFEDTARGDWRQFDTSLLAFRGTDGSTTVGEVGIFAMLWYQGYEYDNEIIGVNEHLFPNGGTYDWFNYTSAPSTGWGNDVFVPYRTADADGDETVFGGPSAPDNDTEYGYVWLTAWDTDRDAREFHRAYREVLAGHGAERVGPNTRVVESGPFADAFRVVRDGRNVTVVNAPTVADLADLRPGLAGSGNAGGGNATTGAANPNAAMDGTGTGTTTTVSG